jgi:cation:H+ antiporter
MEEAVAALLAGLPWPLLALLIALYLFILVRGADILVDQAVVVSRRSGVPKLVIGATIVSLGTTTPEAVVSVLAALQGRPGLALGNAVGSIICDTGLILGLACMIAPLPLDRRIVNRQGWIQFGAGWALVAACLPWSDPSRAWIEGGNLPRAVGILFLIGLCIYLYLSVRWTRQAGTETPLLDAHESRGNPLPKVLAKLIGGIALVVGSSWLLIPAAVEAATRLEVPESIIAATFVAFGTSLPELVTAVTAARRGHGELAVGNVVGADILNVLFVAGAAAAVTGGGLDAPVHFFTLYFPSMLLLLIVFRIGIAVSGSHLRRSFGAILLLTYVAVTVLSYVGK